MPSYSIQTYSHLPRRLLCPNTASTAHVIVTETTTFAAISRRSLSPYCGLARLFFDLFITEWGALESLENETPLSALISDLSDHSDRSDLPVAPAFSEALARVPAVFIVSGPLFPVQIYLCTFFAVPSFPNWHLLHFENCPFLCPAALRQFLLDASFVANHRIKKGKKTQEIKTETTLAPWLISAPRFIVLSFIVDIVPVATKRNIARNFIAGKEITQTRKELPRPVSRSFHPILVL